MTLESNGAEYGVDNWTNLILLLNTFSSLATNFLMKLNLE